MSPWKKKKWVISDVTHALLLTDVERKLDPPDVVLIGSRVYYSFAGDKSL